MAKTGDDTTSNNAVFIDTSLNTHFATVVSSSDTVSDLKQKIVHEHSLCFPQVGDIKVHALKVKRKGCLYHLSDSMLVASIFRGSSRNKCWFISVDASNSVKESDDVCVNLISNDCTNGVNVVVRDASPQMLLSVDNPLSLDVARKDGLRSLETGVECHSKVMSLDGNGNARGVENEVERMPVGGLNEIGDLQGNNVESETESRMKKKHESKKKNEHAVDDSGLKGDVLVPETGRNEFPKEVVVSVVSQDDVMENGKIVGPVEGASAIVSAEGTGGLGKHVELESDDLRRNDGDVQCDKSVEDALQSQPRARKKRKIKKGKNDDEDMLKKDETVISESNEATVERLPVSQRSLVDKQNGKSLNLGSSFTESPEDTHLQPASPSSGKRKRKRKSSNNLNQEIAAVPSSGTDIRCESSGQRVNREDLGEGCDSEFVPRQPASGKKSSKPGVSLKEKHGIPVQEANKRPTSQEIDMGSSDASNVEGKHDASRSAIASDIKSMKASEDHLINVEGSPHLGIQESNETDKEIEVSRHENMVLRDHQDCVVDQKNGVEEQQTSAINLSPKTVPSIECKSPSIDEQASKTKEVAVTSKLLEPSEAVDPSKSSKKMKKSKRTKKVGSGIPSTSVTGHVEGLTSGFPPMKPHKAAHEDPTEKTVTKEEQNVPSKEGKEVSGMEASASILATEKEIDDVIRNAVQSVQQIGQVEASAENIDRKSKKKTKKRTLDAKNLTESTKENEKVTAPSAGDNTREVEVSSSVPLHKQSSQGEQHKTKGNNEGRCLEAVVSINPSENSYAKEGANNFEASCDSSRIDFKNYFVPSQHSHQIVGSAEVLDGTATKVTEADGEMKVKKNKKKLGTQSHAKEGANNLEASCDSSRIDFKNYFVPSQHSHQIVGSAEVLDGTATKVAEADGEMKVKKNKKKLGKQSHVHSSDLQSSYSLNENHEAGAKPSKDSDSGVKALLSGKSNKFNSVPKQDSKGAVTASSLESSKNTKILNRVVNGHQSREDQNRTKGRKTSMINAGEVVNNSQHKRSVIGVSDSLFKDVTDEASSNEDNSDASTRTPSDKSMSSDYSDGESNADLSLSQNGSNSSKRKEGDGKTIRKPFSSGMALDTVLKHSSRYKKAKLTVAQLQLEETESQPVEFVPDSQANP